MKGIEISLISIILSLLGFYIYGIYLATNSPMQFINAMIAATMASLFAFIIIGGRNV